MIYRFWTIAKDETHNWDSETLAEHGIRAAFGLYLICEGEATHLCELAASSRAEWVQNAFLTDDGEPLADAAQELEYESGGDSTSYFKFVDPEKHDSRFIAGPIEIDSDDLNPCEEYGETERDSAWEAARESWQASPDHPAITWDSTFDAWQEEQAAKRRAENRPPCIGPEPLPLFMAAALPLRDAIAARHGIAPGDEGKSPWEVLQAADSDIKATFRALAWIN